MNGGWRRHFIKYAVDQFHSQIVRQGVIVVRRVLSLLFASVGSRSLPDEIRLCIGAVESSVQSIRRVISGGVRHAGKWKTKDALTELNGIVG